MAAAGGAAGIAGLTTAAVLAPGAELALIALPVVMGPGAFMSGHRFLNSSSTSQPPCGGIKIVVSDRLITLYSLHEENLLFRT